MPCHPQCCSHIVCYRASSLSFLPCNLKCCSHIACYRASSLNFHALSSSMLLSHCMLQSIFLEFPCLVILNAALTLTAIILVGFVCYHVWLVATNQTTNELYKSHKLSVNPYNRGLLANITEVLFPKRSVITTKTRKRRR